MRFKKNYKPTFFAFLISTVCFGCSSSATTNDTTKNNNINQSTAVSNINALPSTTPAVINGNLPASSNSTVNKNSKPLPSANTPSPKIGSGGNDMALFMQVRGALGADSDLVKGVIVEVKEGNASLSGKVPSEEKKKKAEQLVRSINGIKNVKNDLQVAP